MNNYHLCIDSGIFGIEGSVNILEAAVKNILKINGELCKSRKRIIPVIKKIFWVIITEISFRGLKLEIIMVY